MVSAAPARAELAFFANGTTLSIKAHRLDWDHESLILVLRGGGEMTLNTSAVVRITPDEVPYPEPEHEVASPAASIALPGDASPYAAVIDRVAREHGVDVKLVRAVIQVESAYRETARSRKGAIGLMQLMPQTARQYAVADPYDPVANIQGGIRYLKTLLERWPRDLALAAYNAGETAVQRFRGIPPYPETRAYVARILQLAGH